MDLTTYHLRAQDHSIRVHCVACNQSLDCENTNILPTLSDVLTTATRHTNECPARPLFAATKEA